MPLPPHRHPGLGTPPYGGTGARATDSFPDGPGTDRPASGRRSAPAPRQHQAPGREEDHPSPSENGFMP
jgi:hypothetical protein